MTTTEPDKTPVMPLMSLLACVLSAVMAFGLCYFRHYLGGAGPAIFITYWFEFVILAAALALGGRWYLFWFALALLAQLGLGALSVLKLYLVAPLGMAALLLLGSHVHANGARAILAGGLAAAGLGALYFLTINGIGYANLLLPERILAGLAYPDTLFHTALASMLSNYGELASALNGLVPIRYHAFSHLWLGLAAKGAGLNAVHGYYLGLQILALPLLLLGLSGAAMAFGAGRRGIASVVAIALLFAFDSLDWMSYLTSESHMVGMALLLIGIPALRKLADTRGDAPNRTALLSLGFAIIVSAAKISVGATWTVAVLFLLLRQRRLSPVGMVAAAVLLLLHAWLAIRFFLPNDNISTTGFEPLHFVRSYPAVAAINFAVVGAAAFFHLRDWRRGTHRLWHEAILLMLLVDALPTLLLRVEGGSAYYFINIAAWISIASLSARLAAQAVSPRLVSVACMAVILAMTVLTPQRLHAYGTFKNQRDRLLGGSAERRNLFNPGALAAVRSASRASTGGQLAVLMQANGIRPGDDFLIAVQPSFQAFWSLTPQCNAAPFLVPAYFGVPLLDGLPPAAEHCALGNYYGYRLYGSEAQSRPLDDAALCRLTAAKSFHHVLVVESALRARRIDCARP